jgi:hypothetical protein
MGEINLIDFEIEKVTELFLVFISGQEVANFIQSNIVRLPG